jgi:hypothetical protein
MKSLLKAAISLAAVLAMLCSSSVYAAVAGRVQFVHGKVQLTTATGVTHAIRKGDTVNEGDTLISDHSASAQIRMADGGMVAMRPNTRLKIDRFNFDGKEDGTERSFFSLFEGGFRAITGKIGKKNKVNYRITTPATTIGVRGTDHETVVVTPGSALSASSAIGTYNRVNLGETSMTTEKGTIFVLPNQMGFAGAADQMPQLETVNLRIFTVAAQPLSQRGRDRHEGGAEDLREMRETAVMDKDGMRDHATVDDFEVHSTSDMDKTDFEGTTELTPSTDDPLTNTVPIVPDND